MELSKELEKIQPGTCFGHHDEEAKECSTCFVAVQCGKNTRR